VILDTVGVIPEINRANAVDRRCLQSRNVEELRRGQVFLTLEKQPDWREKCLLHLGCCSWVCSNWERYLRLLLVIDGGTKSSAGTSAKIDEAKGFKLLNFFEYPIPCPVRYRILNDILRSHETSV
jgi:hypothetical protein